MKIISTIAAATLALSLAACSPQTPAQNAQDLFWQGLSAHCGKAFAGRLVSNDEVDADMAGKAMRIHVASCNDSEIKIPFHIETAPRTWNRSRTWIITRTGEGESAGLRLKHDHRHEDGSSDKVTMYGGDTAPGNAGNAARQEFPVDAESIAMFEKNDLAASVTNVWAVEVDGKAYTYELSRENRLFRVSFDLTREAEIPPLPWGWDASKTAD